MLTALSRLGMTVASIVAPRPAGRVIVELDDDGKRTRSSSISDVSASLYLRTRPGYIQRYHEQDLKSGCIHHKGFCLGSVRSNHGPKRPRVNQLDGQRPSTSPTNQEVKPGEEEIDILLPSASSELWEDSRAVPVGLKESMYVERSIHNLDFRNLVEEHEVVYGECMVEAGNLVVTDAPHNIKRVPRACSQIITSFLLVIKKQW